MPASPPIPLRFHHRTPNGIQIGAQDPYWKTAKTVLKKRSQILNNLYTKYRRVQVINKMTS